MLIQVAELARPRIRVDEIEWFRGLPQELGAVDDVERHSGIGTKMAPGDSGHSGFAIDRFKR